MHTPTPWGRERSHPLEIIVLDERRTIVCIVSGAESNPVAVADAEFIVRAANCHDELLAVLKLYFEARETGRSIPPYVVEQAKIVLAKAEEETEFFRLEKLTEDEKGVLQDAEKKVRKANEHLHAMRRLIERACCDRDVLNRKLEDEISS